MLLFRIIVFLTLISTVSFSQFNGHDFSFNSSLVYTTSAEIFLNPNSADPVIRNRSFAIVDIINPALDLRFRLSEPLIIGISTEYMSTSQTSRNLIVFEGSNQIRLETEDGFKFIPVELSLYYQMPFSTTDFKFLMGGGAGLYIGEFTRKFGDTQVSTLEKQIAFGIQVSMSMEYILIDRLGLRLEMKFRDPEFKSKSKYDKDIVNYNGSLITILRDTFDTKVNVNGIAFLLGVSFYF